MVNIKLFEVGNECFFQISVFDFDIEMEACYCFKAEQ